VVAVLCAATLISLLAALVVLNQRAAADRQARIALGRQLTQKSADKLPANLGLGLLLAVAAAQFERSSQTRAALVEGVSREPRLLRLTPPSPGGKIVALHLDHRDDTFTSVSQGGAVVRWNVGTMRREGAVHRVGAVKWADISADGRRLATVSTGGRFQMWDLPSMRRLGHGWHDKALRGIIQLSRDGRVLLALSMGTTTRNSVWTITSDGLPTRVRLGGAASRLRPISLGGGGRYVAYGASRGAIVVHDLALGYVRSTYPPGGDEPVGDLELSGDGRTVAAHFDDSDRMLFWHVGSTRAMHRRTGHKGNTSVIEFSPDSRRVAVGLQDGTVTLWKNWTGKRLSGPARADGKAGYAFAFEPGGNWLLYGRSDGTIARLATSRRSPALATRSRAALSDRSFADLVRLACRIVNRRLTPQEWRDYVGAGTRYERICPANPLNPA
jgi:WD40 repeat protein